MIARGFRSVGWVAAVGGAALGCYMLSLQVATERADLARVERQIVSTKQQIRSLQTELGTRGRLSQLERWNSDVLALSAPATGQFLRDEFTLARLDTRDPTLAERAPVRMASLESAAASPPAAAAPAPDAKATRAVETQAAPAGQIQPAIVRRASYTPSAPAAEPAAPSRAAATLKPAVALKPAVEPKPARRLDARLAAEIGTAARAEARVTAPAAADSRRGERNRTEGGRARSEAGGAGTR